MSRVWTEAIKVEGAESKKDVKPTRKTNKKKKKRMMSGGVWRTNGRAV
jgi:hypothetical protein